MVQVVGAGGSKVSSEGCCTDMAELVGVEPETEAAPCRRVEDAPAFGNGERRLIAKDIAESGKRGTCRPGRM